MRYVVTDVARRDASGPNLDLLRKVLRTHGRAGGRQQQDPRLTDIVAPEMDPWVEGAIITALYVGNFTLEEALGAAGAARSDHLKSGNA